MNIRGAFVVVLLAMAISVFRPADAKVFKVDGTLIDLFVPEDYCVLSRDDATENLFYKQQDTVQAGVNRVIAIVADCDRVKAFHQGNRLDEYGVWLLNSPNGTPVRLPANYGRARALKELAAVVPKIDLDEINSKANTAVGKVGAAAKILSYGMIAKDDNAIYSGLLATYSMQNTGPQKMAGVIALTTLQNRILTFNLYSPFYNHKTFDGLLENSKGIIRQTVANDGDQSLPKGMSKPAAK